MDHVFLVPHAHWTSADVFQARLTSTWVEQFFEQAEFVQRSAMTATVSEQEGELCQYFFDFINVFFARVWPFGFAPCVLFIGRV